MKEKLEVFQRFDKEGSCQDGMLNLGGTAKLRRGKEECSFTAGGEREKPALSTRQATGSNGGLCW